MNCLQLSDQQLSEQLHQKIPLFAASEARVTAHSEHSIQLEAPLMPNRNIHGTGFAGSSSSLMSVAAWVLAQQQGFALYGDQSLTVMQTTNCRFQAPISARFEVKAELINRLEVSSGLAIDISASVHSQDILCASSQMVFRVLKARD